MLIVIYEGTILLEINRLQQEKYHTYMLRKGENSTKTLSQNRGKTNKHTEGHPQSNKENLNSKSLFQNISENDLTSFPLKHNQSNCGSAIVSPTFQSNTLVSLKEEVFKQNKGYVEVNLNLKDLSKKNQLNSVNQVKEVPPPGLTKKEKEIGEGSNKLQEERQRLIEHYKSKKYWNKIDKLFAQQGVDAVLAWQDSIDRYSVIKAENSTLKQTLLQKQQVISLLQQQLQIEKNETRIVSQKKKCKDCERLESKEKEYFDLYEQFKKQSKELKEKQDEMASLKKTLAKSQEKYQQQKFLKEEMEKKRALLKEELQKKNEKLVEKDQIEKELTNQILSLQCQERSNSKKLHIECEQLKEFKYQAQKTISKVDQKYKKELNDLQIQFTQLSQQKNIYEQELTKARQEFNELKSKLIKSQWDLEKESSSLALKIEECEDIKKRNLDLLTEEKKKTSECQSLLKEKDEELNKMYQLIEENETAKNRLEVEIGQERKINEEKDEEINRYIEVVRDLQNKIKENSFQLQQNKYQERNKDICQLYRTKNPVNSHSSNSPSLPAGSNSINRKTSSKIRQIYLQIKKINEDSMDSLQRRRLREEDSQESESLTSFQVDKYINQIHADISNVVNKCVYLHNQNLILKEKMESDQEESQVEVKRIRNELGVKEQTLRAVLSFIPEELKDGVVDLLQITQTMTTADVLEEIEEEYLQTKESVENQGREWREHYHRMKFKFRKMEDDLRRLEEENEQLKRRAKTKDSKRVVVTDYDYNTRDGVTKKDIRRKYNFDN